MKRSQFINIYLITSLALGILNCTSTNENLAGGTGTGNPPVVASTVSVIADTSLESNTLKKTRTGVNNILNRSFLEPPNTPFTVLDADSLKFTVESAIITAQKVYFVPEKAFNESTFTNLTPPLKYDSEGIFIEGPFIFNALTGISEPRFDSVYLPKVDYIGIKLLLSDSIQTRRGSPQNPNFRTAPISINGKFTFNDTIHNFTFNLMIDTLHLFTTERPVGLSKEHANFIIALKVNYWLNSINFKACLSDGNIRFNNGGDLVVDQNTGVGPCKGVAGHIRRNILENALVYIW